MNHWHGSKPKGTTHKPNKNIIINSKKSAADKSIEEEVARAVQQLIALNKSDDSDTDEVFPELSDEEEADTSVPIAQNDMEKLTHEGNNFIIPENATPALVFILEHGKKVRKGVQLKRANKHPLLETFNELDKNRSLVLSSKG